MSTSYVNNQTDLTVLLEAYICGSAFMTKDSKLVAVCRPLNLAISLLLHYVLNCGPQCLSADHKQPFIEQTAMKGKGSDGVLIDKNIHKPDIQQNCPVPQSAMFGMLVID